METTGAIRRRAVHFEDQHSDSGSGLSLVDAPLLPVGSAKSHHGGRGKQHPPTPFSSTFNNSTFLSSEGEEGTPSSAQGGWKIGSSPASKAEHISGGSAAADAALLYSPASTSLLASVKKVDDLRARLEQLEATLRDMESRAVEQLDAQLQVGIGLADSWQQPELKWIPQPGCRRKFWPRRSSWCSSGALWRVPLIGRCRRSCCRCDVARHGSSCDCRQVCTLEPLCRTGHSQTARKVVERKAEESLAAAAAAASDTGSDALARRLAFEGGEGDAAASLPAEQLLEQFAAHVESGLGESMRRLERKADMVAGGPQNRAWPLPCLLRPPLVLSTDSRCLTHCDLPSRAKPPRNANGCDCILPHPTPPAQACWTRAPSTCWSRS